MESEFQESQGCYTHSFDRDGDLAHSWTPLIALPRVLRYEATEKKAQISGQSDYQVKSLLTSSTFPMHIHKNIDLSPPKMPVWLEIS